MSGPAALAQVLGKIVSGGKSLCRKLPGCGPHSSHIHTIPSVGVVILIQQMSLTIRPISLSQHVQLSLALPLLAHSSPADKHATEVLVCVLPRWYDSVWHCCQPRPSLAKLLCSLRSVVGLVWPCHNPAVEKLTGFKDNAIELVPKGAPADQTPVLPIPHLAHTVLQTAARNDSLL